MSTPQRFRKKPVVIEAMQFDGTNVVKIADWLRLHGVSIGWTSVAGGHTHLRIPTLEGTMTAQPGDWIIRGVKGEFYSRKPDIFAATYDAAEEATDAAT